VTGCGGHHTRAATTGGGPAEIGTTETATTPDTDRIGIIIRATTMDQTGDWLVPIHATAADIEAKWDRLLPMS
jgi:hypothetical protein